MIKIGIQIGIQNLARSIQGPDIITFIARFMAEAVGFEPTVGFPLRSVSNRVLSASQPRFQHLSLSHPCEKGQEGKALAHCGKSGRGEPAAERHWLPCLLFHNSAIFTERTAQDRARP